MHAPTACPLPEILLSAGTIILERRAAAAQNDAMTDEAHRRKIHDLGGVPGFGAVRREENEPVFHAAWEGRTYGMRQSLGPGLYRLGGFRWTLEAQDPDLYLTRPYYHRWLEGTISCAIAKGLVSDEEMAERTAWYQANPGAEVPAVLDPERARQNEQRIRRYAPVRKEPAGTPLFTAGDAVTVVSEPPAVQHHRLPGYLLGKTGVIIRNHGGFEANDHTNREDPVPPPEPLYAVQFDRQQLWQGAELGFVTADLWERYLLPPASNGGQS